MESLVESLEYDDDTMTVQVFVLQLWHVSERVRCTGCN